MKIQENKFWGWFNLHLRVFPLNKVTQTRKHWLQNRRETKGKCYPLFITIWRGRYAVFNKKQDQIITTTKPRGPYSLHEIFYNQITKWLPYILTNLILRVLNRCWCWTSVSRGPEEEVEWCQITRSLWPIVITSSKDNMVRKLQWLNGFVTCSCVNWILSVKTQIFMQNRE